MSKTQNSPEKPAPQPASQPPLRDMVAVDSPLVTLSANWALARIPAENILGPIDMHAVNCHMHARVNGVLRDFFSALAIVHCQGLVTSFDMTPRKGASPVDEGVLARVEVRPTDRSQALAALHGCMQVWADQALQLHVGARIDRGPQGQVLLFTAHDLPKSVNSGKAARKTPRFVPAGENA